MVNAIEPMKKRQLTKAQREGRLARTKKIILILLTASIILFLAVFFAFVPFRLMLPAYKIVQRQEGELRLHFLNLDGGVTIVEFPNGETLVVNAGSGSFQSDNTLCRYLRGLDISSLSVMACDSDTSHIGGMPALFQTFHVQKAYLPAFGSDSGAWKRFASALQKEECENENLARYAAIANGSGAYAVCLSPYSGESGDTGDASAVLYLTYAGVDVVLAGGVSAERAGRLVSEYRMLNEVFDRGEYKVRLENTQILCASPGKDQSFANTEWLSLLSPGLCVLSCNEAKSPAPEVIENLAVYSPKVCRTDEFGSVMITIKDGDYTVTPHVAE